MNIQKKCDICKLFPRFSKKMCLNCYKKSFPEKFVLKKIPIEKKNTKINPISKTQEKRFKKYIELRKIYLQEHPFCEARLEGCRLRADQVHHKKGRDGDNLFRDFLSTCDNCHKIIEEMPKMAKERKFSLSRIKTEENNEEDNDGN